MWLLHVHTRELEAFQGLYIPSYAILSHRWGEDEPTFKDVKKKRCLDSKGYQKVDLCCKQASLDGYIYVWVDTCCIDKRSSAELSEAINSMYYWYSKAAVCYVYLSDISSDSDDWLQSQWFTRGWTLQELLAPQKVEFYDSSWNPLGSKLRNFQEIGRRTHVPSKALTYFRPSDFSIAQRMSWAAHRTTTRSEDRAYSLLGVFDVNMPLLYGEGGGKAFYRLQEEIMKISTDPSIFAWSASPDLSFGMLAATPDSFTVPWMTKQRLNQSESIQLEPFDSDYIHSKAGIMGTFCVGQHAFNIYVAWVGGLVPSSTINMEIQAPSSSRQAYTHICIFLQYFPFDGQFHRVQFDGTYCIALGVETFTRTVPTMKKILVGRSEPRTEISNSLSLSACQKLSLSYQPQSMFGVGYLKLGSSPASPPDTSILFVSNMKSASFISCPCIVLENKLFIHFAYDLQQRLMVFISGFEGNLIQFMVNRENLFSPSPPASIEPLALANSSRTLGNTSGTTGPLSQEKRRYNPALNETPSLDELLLARNIKIADFCCFTFLPRIGGHRVVLSFKDAGVGASIPVSWCTPRPLADELWKRLDAVIELDSPV